jgi:formylglycine-generating enzyme required for sulfatase activity
MFHFLSIVLVAALSTIAYSAQSIPVDDLHIELMGEPLVQERSYQLTWSAPSEDVYGNEIEIESYKLYLWFTPFFEVEESVLLVETVDTCYTFLDPDDWYLSAFFRVTAVGNSIIPPPEMVFVPAGSFTMGQDGTNGTPVHEVTITNDFLTGMYEVTNGEYLMGLQMAYDQGLLQYVGDNAVMAHDKFLINPNHTGCEIAWSGTEFILEPVYDGDYEGLDSYDHPVLEVSWYGAACYCDWLSLQEGLEPFYNGDWSVSAEHNPYEAEGYRLPTEAEWEYASRYSDDRTFPWGENNPDCSYVNFNPGSPCVGWTTPVGSTPSGESQLGLQDMAGNLWEWVNDYWGDYDPEPVTDPLGPPSHPYPYRSFRGGSWYYGADRLPSAHRNYNDPNNTRDYLGFRICRTVNP